MPDLTPQQMEHAIKEGVRQFLHEEFRQLFIGYQFRELIADAIRNGVKDAVKQILKEAA